jgi:hypothetical protein
MALRRMKLVQHVARMMEMRYWCCLPPFAILAGRQRQNKSWRLRPDSMSWNHKVRLRSGLVAKWKLATCIWQLAFRSCYKRECNFSRRIFPHRGNILILPFPSRWSQTAKYFHSKSRFCCSSISHCKLCYWHFIASIIKMAFMCNFSALCDNNTIYYPKWRVRFSEYCWSELKDGLLVININY